MFTCDFLFSSFTIRIKIWIVEKQKNLMSDEKLRLLDWWSFFSSSFCFFYNQNQNLNSWKKNKSYERWKTWEIVMFTWLTDWLSYQRKTLHHQTLSGPTSHNLSWKYQILILTMKNTTTNKCFLLNREPTSNCSVTF